MYIQANDIHTHEKLDNKRERIIDDTMRICSTTYFYKQLPSEKRTALNHIIHHHCDKSLVQSLQAISTLEKAIILLEKDSVSRALIPQMQEKKSVFVRLVEAYIDTTLSTRNAHGTINTPILHCCTPIDAYFREVYASLLTVTNTLTTNNLIVTGTTTINGSETITGNLLVGGTLTVTGSSTLSSLTVSGGSNLGPTTISQLDVTGNETVGGSESITGNLLVGGTLTVTGSSTLSSLATTGNLLVGGTLTVTGSSTFNNVIGITSTSATTAATINESGGTGIGLAITGNASQPAVRIAQGTGQNAILTGTGTTAAPSYSFIGSTGTGLYSPTTNTFALAAAGVNKVIYDGSSVLVTSTYRFSATLSANQIVPPSGVAGVVFDSAVIGSANYNTGTGVYTAPISGTYLVTAQIVVSNTVASASGVFAIAKNNLAANGAESVVAFPPIASQPVSVVTTAILPINAGDTISFTYFNSSLGTVTIDSSTRNSIAGLHLLSVN